MHILICVFGFPPEDHGVANVAYQHALGFMKKDHKVTVATSYHPLRKNMRFPLGIETVEFKTAGNAQIRSRYKGEVGRYMRFISSFQGDVICCHGWQTWSTDLAVQAFRKSPARKVLVSHGVSVNSLINWKSLVNWILWRPYVWRHMVPMLRSFDHLVFLCNKMGGDRFYDRKLAESIGFDRLSVIPNGADVAAHQEAVDDFRRRFGISTRYMLLCVGSYSALKNERMVLKAFVRAGLEDATLVFVGRNENAYCRQLKRSLRKADLRSETSVAFLKGLSRQEILSAYKTADLYLCGSRTECFPLVILDAMASGTPYISTEVGCISEFPGGVPVRSAEEMSEAMRSLLRDKRKRRKFINEGFAACKETYNWDHVANCYDTLFQKLCRVSDAS